MYKSTKDILNRYTQMRPRDQLKHDDWNYIISVLSQQIDLVEGKITEQKFRDLLNVFLGGNNITPSTELIIDIEGSTRFDNINIMSMPVSMPQYLNSLSPYPKTVEPLRIMSPYLNNLEPYKSRGTEYLNILEPYVKGDD